MCKTEGVVKLCRQITALENLVTYYKDGDIRDMLLEEIDRVDAEIDSIDMGQDYEEFIEYMNKGT